MSEKENIEFLRRFFNENPSPFIQVENSKVLYANSAAEGLLGIKEGSKLPPELQEPLRKSIESGKQVSTEFTTGRKTCLFLFKPLKKTERVNIYSTDISSIKKTKEKVSQALRKLHTAQQQLREANKKLFDAGMKYRSLFKKSRDALMILEPPEWRFTSGNPAAVKLFKTGNEAEFTSLSPWQLSPETQPDGRKSSVKAKEMIKKAVEEGSSFFEWSHKTLDGKEFPSMVLLSRMETDEEVFILASVRDITDRKRNKEALEKRLTYEHLLTEISSESITTKNLGAFLKNSLAAIGRTISVSRAYIFEYDDESQTVSNTFQWCSPGTKSRQKSMQNIPSGDYPWELDILKAKKYICFSDIKCLPSDKEKKLLRSKGILSIFIAPLFVRKQFFGFIGVEECSKHRDWQNEDINFLLAISRIIASVIEHNHAENEIDRANAVLESIVENIPKMMLFLKEAKELKFVRFNKAGEELLGIPRSELYGKTDYDFFPKDQAEFFIRKDREVLRDKEVVDIPEEPIKTKDKGERILHTIKVPILNEKGEPEYLLGISEDITEGKKAQERLRKSESYNRSIIGVLPDIIIRINREGEYLDILGSFTDKLPLPKRQLLGKKIKDVFPKKEAERIMKAVKKSIKENCMQVVEYKLSVPSGELWFEARIISSGDNEAFSLIRDITDRKKTQAEIVESEQRYHTLADSGQALIWTSGTDRKRNYFNRPWLEFTGRTLEQEQGDGWTESVHPEDLSGFLQAYTKAFDRRQPYSMEYRLRHASGRYRWILDDGTPRFDSEGNFLGYIGHCLDITERKRAEKYDEKQAMLNSIVAGISSNFINVTAKNIDEKLELMLKNCGEFFGVDRSYLFKFSANNRYMTNTHEWCRKGIEPQKHKLKKIPLEKVSWFMEEMNIEGYVNIKNVEEIPEEGAWERQHFKSQNIKSMLCVPVRNRYSRLTGFMGFDAVRAKKKWKEGPVSLLKVLANIVADALENVKIENQIIQAQKMETAGCLAGWICRDFSSVISSMVEDTEQVLEKSKLSAQVKKNIGKVLKAAKKLENMTVQLKTFTENRPQSSKLIDINTAVKGNLKMICSLIGEEINVKFKPGKEKMPVKIDPQQLNRILVNLALNSRDAISGKGTVIIKTSGMDVDEDIAGKYGICAGSYARIVFSDNGRGMKPEVLSHIFEPGFTGRENGCGAGLGLATVYKMVRQNGGFIEVSSRPGEGCRFEIHFPLHSSQEPSVKKEGK